MTQLTTWVYVGIGVLALSWLFWSAPESSLFTSSTAVITAGKKPGGGYFIVYTGGPRTGK